MLLVPGAVSLLLALAALPQEDLAGLDWPQWRGPKRDGVWRETGLLERFPGGGVRVRWSVPVGGGYSGPSVAGGRVYVMDRPAESGLERLLCLDWKSGARLWELSYPASYEGFTYAVGPRASVTVHDGLAYALGAAGRLHCVDAVTGAVAWERDLRAAYQIRMPNWGISSSPLIEGDLLITQVGGAGDACVVALDRKTGVERWKAFPDEAAYAAPVAIDHAGRRVVVLPVGYRLIGFAPGDGKLLWSHDFGKSSWPIAIPGPVFHGDRMFFTSAHAGGSLFRLRPDRADVELVWARDGRRPRSVDTISSVTPSPLAMNGLVFGVQVDGELRCLDLETGTRLWETTDVMPKAWHATMHIVRAGDEGDRVWIFNEQGELILASLAREGYRELTRAKLLDPTIEGGAKGRPVAWAHPAFAYRHVFARNDRVLVAVDLGASH